MEKQAVSQGIQAALEVGKSEAMDLPLKPPSRRNMALPTNVIV